MKAAIVLASTAIASCVPDTGGPVRTFRLECISEICEDLRGPEVWGGVGLVEDDTGETIYVNFVPGLAYGGEANRGTNTIWIRAGMPTFNRQLALAHEVGHVALDTPEHTTCGVMGGVDVQLCDEDIELAHRCLGTD